VYFSPDIIRILRSRSRRWAGHVAHMGRKRNAYGACFKNLKERFYLEYLGMDGWIILNVFSINAVRGMD
jgi:hypothetical protein